MRKLQLFGAALLISASAMIYSCKKDKDNTTTTDDSASFSSNAADESNTQSESDQAVDDANTVLGTVSSTKGRYSTFPAVCGATIDSSQKNGTPKTIILHYDKGTNCNGKVRSGDITLTLTGTKWKDVGSVITMTFSNYKVVKNGKSLTFNGNHIITNVSGGIVGIDAEVIHKVRGTMQVTFDNLKDRTWNVARKTTYTLDNTTRKIKIEGDTTVNSIPNVVIWGVNRNGENFYSAISTPLQSNSVCGWNQPTAGVKSHSGPRNFTVTFGVDQLGNPGTFGPANCASYYKVEWTGISGAHKQAVISY